MISSVIETKALEGYYFKIVKNKDEKKLVLWSRGHVVTQQDFEWSNLFSNEHRRWQANFSVLMGCYDIKLEELKIVYHKVLREISF